MEKWKSLKGLVECGEYYEVSDLGRVRSVDRIVKSSYNRKALKKGKILKQRIDKDGYSRVYLKDREKSKNALVHRLVALAFIPNVNNLPQVNHKNEIKTCNIVENLEWCSCKYNINYGSRSDKMAKSRSGEKHPFSKRIKAYKIKSDNSLEYVKTFGSIREAGKELGFRHAGICKVLKGEFKQTHGYYFEYAEVKSDE